jgi:23S rRNA pseudouridine1911/1915/1917 synthase
LFKLLYHCLNIFIMILIPFSKEHNKKGDAYLGLVHRIDRVTSGITVFAKTSKSAARLSDLFKTRDIIKYYVCVVNGLVNKEYDECADLLLKTTEKKTQVLNIRSDRKDAVAGVLRYKALHQLLIQPNAAVNSSTSQNSNKGDLKQTLLAIELETGRKHQIRAQLENIGHSVVGDVKYGAGQRFQTRDIALHAALISFPHPTLNKQVSRMKAATVTVK